MRARRPAVRNRVEEHTVRSQCNVGPATVGVQSEWLVSTVYLVYKSEDNLQDKKIEI